MPAAVWAALAQVCPDGTGICVEEERDAMTVVQTLVTLQSYAKAAWVKCRPPKTNPNATKDP